MIVSAAIEDPAWNAIPDLEAQAERAVAAALKDIRFESEMEIAVLFSSDEAVAALNRQWRGKAMPTNVLSFPAPADRPVPDGEARPLGDIVLAAGVVAREAAEQGKTLEAHTLHLLVHGALHLAGHDHVEDAEADAMESLERLILSKLGVADPYGDRP